MLSIRRLAAVAAAALVASAVSASAVTITVLSSGQNGPDGASGLDAPSYGAILPPGATSFAPPGAGTTGSATAVCRTPYAGSAAGNSYFCITPAEGAGAPPPGVLTFATPQTSLTMLWGSIDTYNTLTFNTSDGPDVVTGFDVASAITAAGGTLESDPAMPPGNFNTAGIFNFSFAGGTTFTSVTFASTLAAFEFAFVPLPAAAWLLLGGLGGLGLVARRRKALAA